MNEWIIFTHLYRVTIRSTWPNRVQNAQHWGRMARKFKNGVARTKVYSRYPCNEQTSKIEHKAKIKVALFCFFGAWHIVKRIMFFFRIIKTDIHGRW